MLILAKHTDLPPPTMMMRECCDAIIADANNPALNYAVNYARFGRVMQGEEAKVQALYILNNIAQWRGDTATNVRNSLKVIAGSHEWRLTNMGWALKPVRR